MRFTKSIRDIVTIAQVGPAERLMRLVETIQDLDATRFDISVRAWAKTEPLVAEIVKRSDETRYGYVRAQFRELGFSGDELEMRTRTFVVFYSLQDAFALRESAPAQKRQRELRHRLLTSK